MLTLSKTPILAIALALALSLLAHVSAVEFCICDPGTSISFDGFTQLQSFFIPLGEDPNIGCARFCALTPTCNYVDIVPDTDNTQCRQYNLVNGQPAGAAETQANLFAGPCSSFDNIDPAAGCVTTNILLPSGKLQPRKREAKAVAVRRAAAGYF